MLMPRMDLMQPEVLKWMLCKPDKPDAAANSRHAFEGKQI